MSRRREFEVSVVTTLMFPRGQALRSLASWTAQQSIGGDAIQLVIATNGADRELERAVAATLRAGDRLVELATDNEMEMYDAAARSAGGRWLLFTEPHVIARPDCIANLLRRCRDGGFAGACVRTVPAGEANWVAHLESRMYRDDADTWSSDDDWRKFTKRGVMLSRQAYFAAGGLEHRYRRFAEMAIAARLRDRGLRLGYAADAEITHFNSTELSELTEYVREFQREACAFARDFPEVVAGAPAAPRLGDVQRLAGERLRCVWTALRQSLPAVYDGAQRRVAVTLAAELPSLAALCLRGPRAVATAGYYRARAKLLMARLSGDADWCYDAFLNLWRRAGDLGIADFVATHAAAPSAESRLAIGDGAVEVAGISDHCLAGFHPAETWQGKSFRWTSPVATVRVAPPHQPIVVRLELLWPEVMIDGLRLFVDGYPAATRRGRHGIEFPLVPAASATDDARYLTLIAPRFTGASRHDSRRLGVALATLHFERG